MYLDTKEIVTIIISTFLFSFIITPFIKKIAFHIKSVDKPNKRRINKIPMPTLGGLVIFLTFIFGYMVFASKIIDMIPIILGGIIILITGMIDDLNPIKAKYKFIGQFIAAIIVVLYGGLVIEKVDAFGIYIDFGMFDQLISIIFILGMINAVNFIDGLDGLATGISEIFFITIAIISFVSGKYNGLDIYLTLIMLGTTLGFLIHNFYPAKIYLGDSGAMLLGYIVSIIAILGFKSVTLTSFVVPLFIMAIPILDTAWAILRRIINKKSIMTADKMHLHHRLLSLNISHRNTVLLIYLMNSLFALSSIIYAVIDKKIGIVLYIILFIVFVIIVYKIGHKTKK
ncbi:MAG: undecaprenyl/decaprenyl-phosphate alpha-N-acetylglucosaminyl 1-phosphate transferase [Tenericutes bacterium]|nr:MraY family glycosyltransferase [Bacilli bacterium]MDD4831777.1 MraY family glycosyltransferase [Bacilli bacterium]NLV89899.1 undecaprenyl/decaprenyl-phosphate alpha-N-acetylglucosaminyl 1-phosphate transferase [Mycoplasmatota bacterium]